MLAHLIKHLNLKVTAATTTELPKGFLSMGELANALNGLRVANISVKLPAAQLPQINFPAIAHCQTEEQMPYFVVLKSCQDGVVSYFEEGRGEVTEGMEKFGKKWQGITLLLSANAQSGEPNYVENRKNERRAQMEQWLVWGAVGLVLLSPWLALLVESSQPKAVFSGWFLMVLYALGAGASVLLLQNEYGQSADWVQRLCNLNAVAGANKSGGCNTVTQSAAGSFLGFSWAEIGLVYFGGAALSLVIGQGSLGSFVCLPFLHLLALLYVPYSLYYQAFVAKTWCALCLVVQGLIVLIVVAWFVALSPFSESISYSFSFRELSGFGVVITFWLLLKPIWKRERQLLPAQREAMRWQRDSDLFLSHLHAQPAIETDELPHEEQIGNPDAPVRVTMVSNPTCNPCKEAHQELTEWTHYFEDEMQLCIRHINTGDARYQSHDEWAKQVNIEYTPTLFINGYRLRQPYSFKDLRRHVRALAENQPY